MALYSPPIFTFPPTPTIHSPFSPMLLYFPLSPSSTIHFLLHFIGSKAYPFVGLGSSLKPLMDLGLPSFSLLQAQVFLFIFIFIFFMEFNSLCHFGPWCNIITFQTSIESKVTQEEKENKWWWQVGMGIWVESRVPHFDIFGIFK